MNAIEFIGKEENGTIRIPARYRGSLTKNFRVIILVEEKDDSSKHKKKRKFSSVSVDTTDLVLDRDEANER